MAFGSVLATAAVMFAATNIDDALLLVVFFANAAEGKDGMQRRHVWIGQVVGFTLILVLSLVGTAVGSFLPPHYSGLLGFIPMFMGFWRMRAWCAKDEDSGEETEMEAGRELGGKDDSPSQYQDMQTPKARTSSSTAAAAAEVAGVSGRASPELSTQDGVEETSENSPEITRARASRCLAAIFSIHAIKIIGVTLANGGDNVAIYIPVLVTYNVSEILFTIVIFYVMLALWLYVTSAFVSFRFVAVAIDKYGDYVIPVALVLLGVYILWSADTIELVCSSC